MKSIYQKAVEFMMPEEIGNHRSDLYLKKTPVSDRLVSEYEFKKHVTLFKSAIDNSVWYDIPFAYDPYVVAVNN